MEMAKKAIQNMS